MIWVFTNDNEVFICTASNLDKASQMLIKWCKKEGIEAKDWELTRKVRMRLNKTVFKSRG